MSGDAIEAVIAEIEALPLGQLRKAWRRRYGAPPRLQSVQLMRMMLAWRVQADAFGGLDETTLRALAKKGAPQAEGLELGIGARLTRNWKGKSIEVVVEENGFNWQGKTFSSLSAAATAIAGAKWNGPRFFGLRDS